MGPCSYTIAERFAIAGSLSRLLTILPQHSHHQRARRAEPFSPGSPAVAGAVPAGCSPVRPSKVPSRAFFFRPQKINW